MNRLHRLHSRDDHITDDTDHRISYVYIDSDVSRLDRSFVLNSCYELSYLLDTEHNTIVPDQFSTKPVLLSLTLLSTRSTQTPVDL